MFNGLKNDLQQLSSAIEMRLTPQWAEPLRLCHFQRGSAFWEFSYLAPSPQGQSGSLLALSRNGKRRFTIQLHQPETELPLWRDALKAVLTDSDQRDVGWWTRLTLRLRGRRIECSRMVTREQNTIAQNATDLQRYYIARLAGWTQPCVFIVGTDKFSTSTSIKISSSSIRLSPSECRQMADALHRFSPAGNAGA